MARNAKTQCKEGCRGRNSISGADGVGGVRSPTRRPEEEDGEGVSAGAHGTRQQVTALSADRKRAG